MRQIPEKDWKKLRQLKDPLLQSFCDSVLNNLKSIIENRSQDSHKAYLDLYKSIHEEDDILGSLFNDLKRSNAFFKLATWKKHGILSDDDFSKFSEETQNVVNTIISV